MSLSCTSPSPHPEIPCRRKNLPSELCSGSFKTKSTPPAKWATKDTQLTPALHLSCTSSWLGICQPLQMTRNWTRWSTGFRWSARGCNQIRSGAFPWYASYRLPHYSQRSRESKGRQTGNQSILQIKYAPISCGLTVFISWRKTWLGVLVFQVKILHVWQVWLVCW